MPTSISLKENGQLQAINHIHEGNTFTSVQQDFFLLYRVYFSDEFDLFPVENLYILHLFVEIKMEQLLVIQCKLTIFLSLGKLFFYLTGVYIALSPAVIFLATAQASIPISATCQMNLVPL